MQRLSAGLHTAGAGIPAARGAPKVAPATGFSPLPPALQQQQHGLTAPRRSAVTAAALASTAAPVVCPLSAAAFSTALDAGSGLSLTWLSHWRELEARRAARRSFIEGTRGRKQQRMLQLATLLDGANDDGAASAGGNIAWQRQGSAPTSSSSSSTTTTTATPSSTLPGWEEQLLMPSSGSHSSTGSSLDLPPLQQMSEMDELTWLASHPPDGDAAAGAPGGLTAGGMPLWLRQQQEQQQAGGNSLQQHPAGLTPDGSGGGSGGAAVLQGPVQLRVGSDRVNVRPLWIAVYQPEEEGPAKLFETVAPLLPDLVGRLSADVSPFCSVPAGLRFAPAGADEAGGAWRNYFVGLVGSVAAEEDEILWPNQVLHRDRVLFNLRNGWDLARFLADPRREDVEEHRDNLLRLAAERGYRRGYAWHMLRLRWGDAALRAMGLHRL